MKILVAATIVSLSATSASAACYADYKAKKSNPLRLHYGVVQLSDSVCSVAQARNVVKQRIASSGWTLLNVMSVFDDSGLAQRKDSAGQYFLRF